jgi:hypothetical protein
MTHKCLTGKKHSWSDWYLYESGDRGRPSPFGRRIWIKKCQRCGLKEWKVQSPESYLGGTFSERLLKAVTRGHTL